MFFIRCFSYDTGLLVSFQGLDVKNGSLIGYSARADGVKVKQLLHKKDTLKLSL
jgi:hypothetical protein